MPQAKTALRLAPAQIDGVVQALRDRPGDHIRRGRGGDACRDGVFVDISVEEDLYSDGAFADEAALRQHLEGLDLDDRIRHRYRRAVFEDLLGTRLL